MADGASKLNDQAARRQAARNEQLTGKAKRRRFLAGIVAFFVGIWSWIKKFFIDCAVFLGLGGKFVWRGLPDAIRSTLEFVASCVALGLLCVMSYWETNNSGLGWALIFNAWGIVAWFGGVAMCGWAMWANRQAQEQYRSMKLAQKKGDPEAVKDHKMRARRWMLQTALASMVTLIGVFSNLVSHASMDAGKSREVSEDRAAARQIVRRLEREKSILPKPEGIDADKETLAGYLAEASGWGMENLDPDGACKADLRAKRMRDLCNLSVTVRADIAEAGQQQAALDLKQKDIDNAQANVDKLQPIAGAQHYERMAELIRAFPGVNKDLVTGDFVQTWVIFAICVFGFFVTMLGWDSFGERVDKKKAQALQSPPSAAQQMAAP